MSQISKKPPSTNFYAFVHRLDEKLSSLTYLHSLTMFWGGSESMDCDRSGGQKREFQRHRV